MEILESKISKLFRLLKSDDIITVIKEIYYFFIVRIKKIILRDKKRFANWKGMKNKYLGKRVFLLGNGPSLNKTPLHLLKNEYTICFNRFNLMFERLDWRPTFYTTVDERVAEDISEEINEFIPNIQHVFFPDIHPKNANFTKFINSADNVYWMDCVGSGFYTDLPRVGINATVANVGLQILAYLGFTEIYLIGVDMDYGIPEKTIKHDNRNLTSTEDNDLNHFDPRYFGKGSKYHMPRIEDKTLPGYKRAKIFLDLLDIDVKNAGIGGKLEVFNRIKFRSLFQLSKEEELHLFLEKFQIEGNYPKLEAAFPHAFILNHKNEWDEKYEHIITSYEIGLKMISKIIFTHIPHGPIENKYLFVKRLN